MNRYFFLSLTAIGMLGTASELMAGSERWIMSITTERMVSEKIIHARFVDRGGHVLESEVLKVMEVRKNDCATGELVTTPLGYKFGFDPETKLIGLMLPTETWKQGTLCFSVKDAGKVKAQLDEASQGKSIVLTLGE